MLGRRGAPTFHPVTVSHQLGAVGLRAQPWGGVPGSVLLPARRGLQGDSQTGGLSPPCLGSPRLHPEEQGSDRVS